jgi:hypothetical protein
MEISGSKNDERYFKRSLNNLILISFIVSGAKILSSD